MARSHRRALAHRAPVHRAGRGVPASRDDRRRRHRAGGRRGARPGLRAGVARARGPRRWTGTAAERRLPRPGRGDGGVPRGARGDDTLQGLPRGGQRGGAGRPHGRHPGRGVASPAAAAGLDRRRRRDAGVRRDSRQDGSRGSPRVLPDRVRRRHAVDGVFARLAARAVARRSGRRHRGGRRHAAGARRQSRRTRPGRRWRCR